jgi:hypothetical protein
MELLDQQRRVIRRVPALPSHGHRQLQADHIVVAQLVAFFNPAVTSLRRIEDVFQSPKARRRFALPRVPRSTLADAQALFDPSVLIPLIESLKQRLPALPHDPRLDDLTRQRLAGDGTFFAVASRITWAVPHKYNNPQADDPRGHVRVDVHFDIAHGVPDQTLVSPDARTEPASLAGRAGLPMAQVHGQLPPFLFRVRGRRHPSGLRRPDRDAAAGHSDRFAT